MDPGQNKLEVISFFENYILKYIVLDLEILNNIEANSEGVGGCAIPQANSTFSAIDLLGYLIHPQDLKAVGMSFTELLKNTRLFPDFGKFIIHAYFFDSFRDNARSIMTHRYSLTKYVIAKDKTAELFFDNGSIIVFNVSRFTEMCIKAIKTVYEGLKDDSFIINGFSNADSVKKIKDRIEKLKLYEGTGFIPPSNLSTSTTTQTTMLP